MFDDDPLFDPVCPLCTQEVGDEEHYLLRCSHFAGERQTLIGDTINSHAGNFARIMAMKDMTARDLNRLARFLGKVMDTLREHSTLDDTINYDVAMLFD